MIEIGGAWNEQVVVGDSSERSRTIDDGTGVGFGRKYEVTNEGCSQPSRSFHVRFNFYAIHPPLGLRLYRR